jgi:ATP-dependent HslUV protease ATP-binding subunit HslU
MNPPIEHLTPREIVAQLDAYIVGQEAAKRAVAVALRNRYRRQQLPEAQREDILPKNILMIGPTGVGKTEIARRLAQLAKAPFVKVEATKFTEVGYVGRDVESMVRDLVAAAVRLVESEKLASVRPEAEARALETLADLLDSRPTPRRKSKKETQSAGSTIARRAFDIFGAQLDDEYPDEFEPPKDRSAARRRKRLIKEIAEGKYDDELVEVEIEEAGNPFVQVFTPQGMEEMGLDLISPGGPFGRSRANRRTTVREAKEALIAQEARKLMDMPGLHREAIVRTEQTGIIFLDELDKIAGKPGGVGPDVSREGVQRDMLPIIEGSTVASKYGTVRTDHILFIAAGAFHMSKPSDLIPELQGRLPIRVELKALSEADFRKILREPKNALLKQYQDLLAVDGVQLEFEEEAIDEIARVATEVNSKTENIGARRLHTVLERLLEGPLFDAPDRLSGTIRIKASDVREALGHLAQDLDLSRFIL